MQGSPESGPDSTGVEAQGGSQTPHRWLAAPFRFAVAIGLLAFLFSRIPAAEVLAALSSAHGVYLAAALGITVVIQLVLATRLTLVARVQRIPLTLARAVEIDLSARFYGLFAPGGNLSGAAIRGYKLAQPPGAPLASVASIIFDRLIATVALGAVGQCFWMLERPPNMLPVGLVFMATWAAPLALYLFALAGRRRFESSGQPAGGRLSYRLERTKESARRFRDMSAGALLVVLTASILVHLLGVVLYFTLASSLQIEISFVSMGWISTATTLLTLLPVSASGLGLREGALVYLLALYGVPGAAAIALSFLFFALRYLLMGLLGGLIEARGWLSRPEPY